jgi:hypothetical protein
MKRESAIFWAALEFPQLVSGRDWRCDKVKPDEVERWEFEELRIME